MAISFEIPERVLQERQMLQYVAETAMRPYARHLDENEHERPTVYVSTMWPIVRDQQAKANAKLRASLENGGETQAKAERKGPSINCLRMVCAGEMLAWGDLGQYMGTPMPLLAGVVIEAVGTTEQKLRFLTRFGEGDDPKWGAMAMTEPNAGSDTSSIETTAVLDSATNEWVLNGWKIFCTNGTMAFNESDGVIVVWATVDRTAGRAGMKPFVIERGTTGVKIVKQEIKHGIRASDTAAIVLDNARIPYDNLLGSPEVRQKDGGNAGFKGAMATFDASRPMAAAVAMGIGRAALEFTKARLAEEGIVLDYSKPRSELTAVERDVLEMEMQLQATCLLTLRATSMLDNGQHNSLEASMAKAKAGRVVALLTQKAVELLGTMGYSRDWLVEKWMRDGRVNSIYEGTDQINLLIVARRILGYTSRELQ
jgi:acyl-CoA dehydrogenase